MNDFSTLGLLLWGGELNPTKLTKPPTILSNPHPPQKKHQANAGVTNSARGSVMGFRKGSPSQLELEGKRPRAKTEEGFGRYTPKV